MKIFGKKMTRELIQKNIKNTRGYFWFISGLYLGIGQVDMKYDKDLWTISWLVTGFIFFIIAFFNFMSEAEDNKVD